MTSVEEDIEIECVECGGDLADEIWEEDGEDVYCIFCYYNIFGEG